MADLDQHLNRPSDGEGLSGDVVQGDFLEISDEEE